MSVHMPSRIQAPQFSGKPSVHTRHAYPRAAVAGTVSDDQATFADIASASVDYAWRKHWYPVTFVENLPEGAEPLAFSVYGYGVVLWRDAGGDLRCVEDRCPHRSAKLSEGRVSESGALQCQYHGCAPSRPR